MKEGWSLPEIDGMDICWFLRLMGKRERIGEVQGTEKTIENENGNRGLYIDQFGLF